MLYISLFFEYIVNILSNFTFLLIIEFISLTLKLCLLIFLTVHGLRSPKLPRPWFFLLPVLIGAMFSDLSWIFSLSHKIPLFNMDYKIVLFILRLAWAWCIIQYQMLSLFIESLIEKKYILRLHQKIFIFFSTILVSLHVYTAFFKYNHINPRPSFEFPLLKLSAIYIFVPILTSIFYTLRKNRKTKIPRILQKQFNVLIRLLIAPCMFSDFVQNYPFDVFPSLIANNFAVVNISTIMLTLAFYFCAKKMMGLRFLNFHAHVLSQTSFSTIERFKSVLEQLSQVTNVKELNYITQSFFKSSFDIMANRVTLWVRQNDSSTAGNLPTDSISHSLIETRIEYCINAEGSSHEEIRRTLAQEKILITDEIAFNDFHNETELTKQLLTFLDSISADLFLPIYQNNNIVGYIVVDKDSRPNRFYSNIERDELVVFASYLGNIINLLHNNDIQGLFAKDKELQEELYRKHQEINQYKESIRSFLRDTQQKKIGIIFYKNRRFTFGNQAATDLIPINLQTHEGHPIARTLHKLAHQVQEYKTGQTVTVKDVHTDRLILSAVPHIEHNMVIILAYHPEISDIIKEQIDLLKDPTDWDYLLYLETTQSGNLIKQLIPGTGSHLLQSRVTLLKAALNKKALLLDAPQDDLMSIVELLHHISLKETLHVLKLQGAENNNEIAVKLFGINPVYAQHTQEGLLERLHNNGTLFIQNIHFLDLETQRKLAEYIRYGFYHKVKSDTKVISNVRIIASTNQNLATLVKKGTFLSELYNELIHTNVTIPPLIALPKKELITLAEQLTEQAIQTSSFQPLLSLTEREKTKLVDTCPTSVHELRTKVQQLLVKKSKKHNIVHEVQFDPTLTITDPELITIARLGKKALKDPKIVATLMQKFKNQTKVAIFLGVNRSSVNRRCKEYNIME